jgi:hypothetical protein
MLREKSVVMQFHLPCATTVNFLERVVNAERV